MSKLDKLKSVFADLKKVNIKELSNMESDLSETTSMSDTNITNIKSDFSEVTKIKDSSLINLKSDSSEIKNYEISDVSKLKSSLSETKSMFQSNLSSLKRDDISVTTKIDITTLKSDSSVEEPSTTFKNTDVTNSKTELNKLKKITESKLVNMTSDLNVISEFNKSDMKDSTSELNETLPFNKSDATALESDFQQIISFKKTDITSFGSVFNTIEVFDNTDLTQMNSDLDNISEFKKSDITDINSGLDDTSNFKNTDITTLDSDLNIDNEPLDYPYNQQSMDSPHASQDSLNLSTLDDLDNPLGQVLDVLGTLSTSALSPIHNLAEIGFTDFWNDGRIFNDYMQQSESEIINDTDYSPEWSGLQWPGPVNFISKTHYGHPAPVGFTLNEYQKSPTHLNVIDDVISEHFPYNKDLELNMYSTAEHTINTADYRFPFANAENMKLYDTYQYDPRHTLMPDLIFNVNPYFGTMFDDNIGWLNPVEDTNDTTHKYSHTLKTINKPSMNTIISSGNIVNGGQGHDDAKLALTNYAFSGGIMGWETPNPDETFADNVGDPHSVIYWNGSTIDLNVWYFSGLDGETPLTGNFNPLQRGLSTAGGQGVRTLQLTDGDLQSLGDQGKLGEGALKFETLYSNDLTEGPTDNKQGRYTDRLKLKGGGHPWTNATNRGSEPYLTFNIGTSDNDGSRGWNTNPRAVLDGDRISKFISSTAGNSWLGWQFMLQFLNPRSSRLFNPWSPQINTTAKAGLKLMVNRGWITDLAFGNAEYKNTVYELTDETPGQSDTKPAKGKFPWLGNSIINFRSGGVAFQVIGDNKKGKTKYKNVGSIVPTSPDQLWNNPLMDLFNDDSIDYNKASQLTSLGSYPVTNKGNAVMVRGDRGWNPRGIIRGSTTNRSVKDVTPAIRFVSFDSVTEFSNRTSTDDPAQNAFGGANSSPHDVRATLRTSDPIKKRASRTYAEIPDDGSVEGRYQDFLEQKDNTVHTSMGPAWKGKLTGDDTVQYAFRNFNSKNGRILHDGGAKKSTSLFRLGDFMTLAPIVRSPEEIKVKKGKTLAKSSISDSVDNKNRIKGSFQAAYLQNGYSEDNDPESSAHGMPFYFKDLRNGEYITFRAYLEGMTETITPTWEGQSYVGRSESLYMYGQTERALSFTLKLAAQTRDELMAIYEKMNALTSLCYPEYKHDTAWYHSWAGVDDPGALAASVGGLNLKGKIRMKPPLCQLRIGDWIGAAGVDKNGFDRAQTGFIDTLTYTIEDGATWETEKQYRVPKMVVASIGYKVIHMKVPEMLSGHDKYAFYGINKLQGKDNQVWPGGSMLPQRNTSDGNEQTLTDKMMDSFTADQLDESTA